jgi:hypothetical protein
VKAYLVITCALFTLLAFAHVLRTVAEWDQLAVSPWFALQGPGIGVGGGVLAVWAWRLLRAQSASARKP